MREYKETEVDCPVPRITHALGAHWEQPSTHYFKWFEDRVEIPRVLFHQLHRYDHSFPTGAYAGKMFLQGKRLVWIAGDEQSISYQANEYRLVGEDPEHTLEPCPLCGCAAYHVFNARNDGDWVRFSIHCESCDLTLGKDFMEVDEAVKGAVEIVGRWNNRI